MKVSLDWISDYVVVEGSPAEVANRLTLNGLNVESIEEFVIEFPGVVIARVETCERHPDADKLSLCTVFDGEQTRQIVCGAPNVRAGLHVLLAKTGAVLPGGIKLKKSKIRGVTSDGMICSATELQLGEDSAGIMELPEDSVPGTPADELYGYRDTVLDIEVTPNRPDWLSHYGVAREIAAFQDSLLDTPKLWSPPKAGSPKSEVSIEIADFADCSRYSAHLARGVKVGPSPRWLRNRLLAIGARPINNIVDITNYVMFELGQPLHGFDLNKLSGKTITVRRARPQEDFKALDGTQTKLGPDHMVIADNVGPIALAGVMGGERTEVDENTGDVLLESAFFSPSLVRRTSRVMQMSSESSYRFEREADWKMVETGALRACYLMQKHAGAHIDADFVDRQNPDLKDHGQVQVRVSQVNRLLGTSLKATAVVQYLQSLGLKCTALGQASDRNGGDATLVATIPSFRRDLFAEVDLIEEVARLFGFDNIEAHAGFRTGGGLFVSPLHQLRGRLRRYLASVGYSEIVTSSFMAREELDRLCIPETDFRSELMGVRNPHHGGETLLRTTLTPSLLRTVQRNVNSDCRLPLRLFQTNRIFLPACERKGDFRHDDEKLLPLELQIFQACVAGRRDEVHGGVPADLMEIKGLIEAVAAEMRLDLKMRPGGDSPYLQPGGCWEIIQGEEKVVGIAGAVARPVLRDFDLEAPVALIEIDLTNLDPKPSEVACTEISRYPAVKRDLSLLVPDNVKWVHLEAAVRGAGGPLLESAEIFDIYRGKGVENGFSAIGIRLKFQSAKGNLKGKAVDKAITAITGTLSSDLGIELRS